MKKRILSALLIFTMATTIIPIHAETKLPAGYTQMAKSNLKISGDSEYYTHVKYYSEPITIIARNQLKRIKDTFSNPNYQNACGTYTEKLCQNTPFSRNLSLLELTIGSIYKNYKKIPRLSCKSGVFSWTFSIDHASLISYVYASVVYSVLTYIITWIGILCGCVLRDINTEKIITT